ncbi:MAG: HlyD family type I secretion periplasmic adaptor subunit [Deltaproteobacteria bacterium]|nr:HlyD family type I secretion periplasmic adaptor subunit [Deltaproteobacteria bacterium]
MTDKLNNGTVEQNQATRSQNLVDESSVSAQRNENCALKGKRERLFNFFSRVFTRKNKEEDGHRFKPILTEIEDRPASPTGRLFVWIIFMLIAITILAFCFISVDVVIQGKGKVIPLGDVKTFQPLEIGVIKKLYVKEGDYVRAGDILVEMDPATDISDLASKEKNLKLAELSKRRINAVLQGEVFFPSKYPREIVQSQEKLHKAQVDAYRFRIEEKEKEIMAMQNTANTAYNKIRELNIVLEMLTEEREKFHQLYEIGAVSKNRYQEKVREELSLRRELEVENGQLEESKIRIEKIKNEIEAYKSTFTEKLLTDLSDKIKEGINLSSDINIIRFKRDKRFIFAPVNGFIHLLPVKTEGGIVSSAQPLISIVPENVPLQIKAMVSNKDVGFVNPWQIATIKVEAYDFQKYGTIEGVVESVSAFNIEDNKTDVYNIYINMKSYQLNNKQGGTFKIKPGMSVMAEINTGKRKVIEFILFPIIKYIDEGTQVR